MALSRSVSRIMVQVSIRNLYAKSLCPGFLHVAEVDWGFTSLAVSFKCWVVHSRLKNHLSQWELRSWSSYRQRSRIANMSEPALRVLLVDDEESLRKPLKKFLEGNFDYYVDAVGSGEEAIQFVEKAKKCYNVALIDDLLSP